MLLPGSGLRGCLLSKSTAAGSEFSKVWAGDGVDDADAPSSTCPRLHGILRHRCALTRCH
eukprot:62263-Chlamydomonas_euryale.AAC.1